MTSVTLAAADGRRDSELSSELIERLRQRTAKTGVIGLGYVGLPLAVEFAKAGFEVTGIDLDDDKVNDITPGDRYIADVSGEDLSSAVNRRRLRATTDPRCWRSLDTVNICVPTPLRKTKDPICRTSSPP